MKEPRRSWVAGAESSMPQDVGTPAWPRGNAFRGLEDSTPATRTEDCDCQGHRVPAPHSSGFVSSGILNVEENVSDVWPPFELLIVPEMLRMASGSPLRVTKVYTSESVQS
jgi:hypothetical protein